MQEYQIPGLAIVIVKDGQVVLKQGFGVKSMETREPVDTNTLFLIASNSKLFTGTALAQLEHNNKLSLNDKITKYFKDFRLYDSLSTSQVTIRDMLAHRIGTKTFQGDFTFWNSKLSRKDIMKGMRYLKPVGSFRQDYGYCNSCYLTAGEVIPVVTGKPWEVYVYDSILMPLQMTNTHMLSQGIDQRNNVAVPYTTSFTGAPVKVPYDRWDNLGPAASMVSNVDDLSKWLLLQLDSGRYNAKQVLPWPILQRTRDVNIIINSRKSPRVPTHFVGYGLGLLSADYNGKQIYWHTGGASGMVSNVCFVPEEKLGIAILTNQDNQVFFEALRYQVLDAFLGVPYINRADQFLKPFMAEEEKTLKQITEWRAKVNAKTQIPRPLSAYAGTYQHELYGTLSISAKDDRRLTIKFNTHNNLSATLSYLGNEEWLLEYNNIEYGIHTIGFDIDQQRVNTINIKANDFIEYDAYKFKKLKK